MNNESHKISVIIGVYNCESTLRNALDSLYTQTYDDFQIIICDDGSVDKTQNILAEYQKKYDNITVLVNETNLGLNATLNKCLKYVNTPYVARMDGDDIALPDRFKTQVEFLDEHSEYAFVSTAMIAFDEHGDFKTFRKPEGAPDINSFIKGTPFYHAPVMVRKDAYDAVGGYSVDSRLLRVEDYHLWIKMYAAGFKGYNFSDVYYKMRDDRNALGRRNWKNRKNEMYVKWIAARTLHLPIYLYPYIIIPMIKYLLPKSLYCKLHRM